MSTITVRYRYREFWPVYRYAPEDIVDHTLYQSAPPGFVLVTFTSKEAEQYFLDELGPSIEPNYNLDLDDYKDYSRTKKFQRGERE